ncbi:MAG: peptide deformylase [Candidatus Saccharimonadales bacterium]
MATKEAIISLPNQKLRQKSQKVGLITPEIQAVISDMKSSTLDWEATRKHEVGVALAAIQINRPLKIIIIRNNFDDKKRRSFSVYLNPQIVKLEGDITEDFEGCLSVEGIYGKVPRYSKVRVKALNERGEPVRLKAEGFLARVLQHEIDHTKGLMFVDHIKNNPQAFYRLTKDGKLTAAPYKIIKNAHIFSD